MFSAVPKPDIDFATDLVKQQTDEVPENLCSFYEWISKSTNFEELFANLFVDMSNEKNIKNWITGNRTKITITNCAITTGKELLQTQKLILFWTKRTRFWNPQAVVLMCGHYVKTYQDFFLLILIYLPWNMVEPWKWKLQTTFLS